MSQPESQPEFDGKAFVGTLSNSPGVYRMFGANDELLYVGKAGSLRKRVGSYFLKIHMDPRVAAMIQQIARIETTVTRTPRRCTASISERKSPSPENSTM